MNWPPPRGTSPVHRPSMKSRSTGACVAGAADRAADMIRISAAITDETLVFIHTPLEQKLQLQVDAPVGARREGVRQPGRAAKQGRTQIADRRRGIDVVEQ